MTVDMNKGITDIEYNNLNLPQKIYFDTGNTTEYLYDAGGAKRQVIHETKRHIPSGELSEGEEITVLPPPPIYTQTDYCGTVVYEDRKVKRILTPEGYLSPKEEVATRGIGIGTPVLIKSDYDYNYFINDYLGNVRAVLTWEEENPYIIGGTPSTYSLTQRNDYYAFGLPTLNSTHSEAQPYKREGKEYDEMHGLNTYDQGARQFNTHLPITPTPDPLAEKYYSISPYAQWGNNPVRYVDPDGKAWYVFDANNNQYIEKLEMDGVHRMAVKNTDKDGNITYDFYDFNDPDVDAKAIDNGVIILFEFLSDSKVENMINTSGVKTTGARNSKWSYAFNEGEGKMDYATVGSSSGQLFKDTFYIREKIAYNLGDIGNYLWGRGMAELGFGLETARLGAHANNMLFGGKQLTTNYDFGPGTYGPPSFWDSPGDQRAIVNGYLSSLAGKKWLEERKKQNEKARLRYQRDSRWSMFIH